MGTTSDKLTYLNTTKEQLKTKINSLGGSITASTPFRDYVDALDDISGGGGYPPDWSLIGYSDTPPGILEGFEYAQEIQENWNSSITDMSSKFFDDKKLIFMPLVDTSNVTSMYNAFTQAYGLISIPLLDTSKVGSFYLAFNQTSIETIPLIDTSSATYMRSMFESCGNLKSIPQIDTSKVVNVNSMFAGCSHLTTIPVLDFSSVMDYSFDNCFQGCTRLSDGSLNNIMRTLIGATRITTRKTLRAFGIDSDQATRCQSLSNYQDFLNAGWTTGY